MSFYLAEEIGTGRYFSNNWTAVADRMKGLLSDYFAAERAVVTDRLCKMQWAGLASFYYKISARKVEAPKCTMTQSQHSDTAYQTDEALIGTRSSADQLAHYLKIVQIIFAILRIA